MRGEGRSRLHRRLGTRAGQAPRLQLAPQSAALESRIIFTMQMLLLLHLLLLHYLLMHLLEIALRDMR